MPIIALSNEIVISPHAVHQVSDYETKRVGDLLFMIRPRRSPFGLNHPVVDVCVVREGDNISGTEYCSEAISTIVPYEFKLVAIDKLIIKLLEV